MSVVFQVTTGIGVQLEPGFKIDDPDEIGDIEVIEGILSTSYKGLSYAQAGSYYVEDGVAGAVVFVDRTVVVLDQAGAVTPLKIDMLTNDEIVQLRAFLAEIKHPWVEPDAYATSLWS